MAEELVTVKVAQGTLRGKKVPSRAGGRLYSFKGVPYAKPPVGPLRFKDPQPLEPWTGVRDAFKEGDCCAQRDLFLTRELMGSEDCLYLNVYAPESARIGSGGSGGKLPVMVWFHSGGFTFGSGNSDLHGPDYLMTENVILVTINYRLGPFGFLFLNHPSAPGNYGLKDQVATLRWVKENIAAFGGDPDNVTIFGESAGGSSVQYHMLSPLSKGLFHRGIAQSGSVNCPWASQYEAVAIGKRLAAALGCTAEEPEAIVAFLRGVDYKELLDASLQQEIRPPKDAKRMMYFPFVPSPEVAAPDAEMFMPAPPNQLVAEGRHHALPYMTGVTTHEGFLLFYYQNLRDESSLQLLDANWEGNVLPESPLGGDVPRAPQAVKDVRDFYMGGKPLSLDTLPAFLDIFSDLYFGKYIYDVVEGMAKIGKAPVYFYNFSVDGELNWLKKYHKIDLPGCCHVDDNGYLFRVEVVDPDLPEDHPSAVARRRVLRLWTNFARTGNPTPEADPMLGVKWEPYSSPKRPYLEIGSQLEMRNNLNKQRYDFWETFCTTYKK